MKPLSILPIALCVALSACMPRNEAEGNARATAHNSRNSLDWAGTYEGVLPCADCPGIKTRLSLRQDGSYELSSEYLERQVAPRIERGQFAWQPGGNAIRLEGEGGGQQFAVGEGRLAWLVPDAAPSWPQSTRFVLTRVAPSSIAPAAADVQGTLESHR